MWEDTLICSRSEFEERHPRTPRSAGRRSPAACPVEPSRVPSVCLSWPLHVFTFHFHFKLFDSISFFCSLVCNSSLVCRRRPQGCPSACYHVRGTGYLTPWCRPGDVNLNQLLKDFAGMKLLTIVVWLILYCQFLPVVCWSHNMKLLNLLYWVQLLPFCSSCSNAFHF